MKNSSTKQKISKVKIRGAEIIFDISNDVLFRYANNLEKIEPETLDWIDNFKKNSVFYDIGASSGPFSLYASIKKQSKVFAFEPDAQNFAILEKNHFLNRLNMKNKLISLNFALSNKSQIGKLFIYEYVPGQSMKILNKAKRRLKNEKFVPAHIQYVVTSSLDEIIRRYSLPLPNYIKIDVDGSEIQLLRGCSKTLSNPKLESMIIEIESSKPENSQIATYLKKFNFSLIKKFQVENYNNLYNCLFFKNRK